MPVLRDKQKRKEVLARQTKLHTENCEGCVQAGGDPDYCRTQCPVGQELLQIGETLLGAKFNQTGNSAPKSRRRKGAITDEQILDIYIRMRLKGARTDDIYQQAGISYERLARVRRQNGLPMKVKTKLDRQHEEEALIRLYESKREATICT